MNLIVRFFISLCVLLLSGYNHAHAGKYVSGVYHLAGAKQESSATNFTPGFRPHTQDLVIKYGPSSTESYKEKMEITDSEDDDEDDELVSLEKYLATANYFTSFLYTPDSGYFFTPINNRIPYCGHFSFYSSDRYILLRVIRI